jgi:hypothetical protein
MKIYFGGCSATYGEELEHPEKDAWPVHIAKYHNAEFLNNGRRAGSNDIIWKEAIAHLHDYDKFYIQWSHIPRITHRDVKTQNLVSFTEQLNYGPHAKEDYYQTFGKYYFSYWANPVERYTDLLSYIISLQTVFEANKKEYVMLFPNPKAVLPFKLGFDEIDPVWFKENIPTAKNMDGRIAEWFHDEMPEKINRLIRRVNKSRFVYDGTFNFINGSPEFGIHPPGKPVGDQHWHKPGGHGSIEAHLVHARIIVEWEEQQRLKGK